MVCLASSDYCSDYCDVALKLELLFLVLPCRRVSTHSVVSQLVFWTMFHPFHGNTDGDGGNDEDDDDGDVQLHYDVLTSSSWY